MKTVQEIHDAVQERYAAVAKTGNSCCGGASCATQTLSRLGYEKDRLDAMPPEALMGLGCGNPVDLAEIRPGETVLDLGSGGGIDVFLAAQKVGPKGKVIGVDMTPEMLARARENAGKLEIENVEFRRGVIEELPVEDACVDLIYIGPPFNGNGNCVVGCGLPCRERLYLMNVAAHARSVLRHPNGLKPPVRVAYPAVGVV